MSSSRINTNFEEDFLPHLNSAYNLALWLLRNVDDAQDVVQESYLKAYKAYPQFKGENPRGWLLKIVRNSSISCIRAQRKRTVIRLDAPSAQDVEQLFEQAVKGDINETESNAIRQFDIDTVHQALGQMSINLREVIVLRELQGLSYKEIASVIDLPIGTVMSRLSRARKQLLLSLNSSVLEEAKHDM